MWSRIFGANQPRRLGLLPAFVAVTLLIRLNQMMPSSRRPSPSYSEAGEESHVLQGVSVSASGRSRTCYNGSDNGERADAKHDHSEHFLQR